MSGASATRFGVLAYGPRASLHREAAASLLTIKAHAPAASEVVLLTDRPGHYRWFGNSITIDRLTPAIVREWRGRYDDPFRPSLEALRRLAAGAVFMQQREYLLAAPPRKNDRPLAHQIVGRSWSGITPDGSSAMWNAGVVGSSRRHAGIFDRTLEVYEEIKPVTRYFAVDQLACSIVFAAYAPIEAAAPWFDHYWGNRQWFNRAIERFLSRALLDGTSPAAAADQLKARPILGALDARAPWWLSRLRRIVSPAVPDDDDVPEFPEPSGR